MTARKIAMSLALIGLVTLSMGCEETEIIEVIKTEIVEVDDVDYLDTCDWRSVEGCGDPAFQCDRDSHSPDDEGICTFAQGAECDQRDAEAPIGMDRCGRGLRCQPDTRSKTEAYLCLPNTCIHNDECGSDEVCLNNTCLARVGDCSGD